MQVYDSAGNRIGKVLEVYIKDYKIYGLLIKIESKFAKKIRRDKILVNYSNVKAIKEVIIIAEKITEHLEKFKFHEKNPEAN